MIEKKKSRGFSVRCLCAAAVFACACNVASIVALVIQNYLGSAEDLYTYASSLIAGPAVISEGIFLCPSLAVFLARRIAIIVIPYASALFLVLIGRVYYLLPFSVTGEDGLQVKYDWPGSLLILLGVLSGAAIAAWVIVRLSHVTLQKRGGLLPRGLQR